MALRKGQAAVEYLIILAVVIIIALVVVGVLGGFPSLTRGVNEKESALYWQGSEIAIQKFYFTSNTAANMSNLVLRNNKNFDIRLNLQAGALQMTDAGAQFQNVTLYCKTDSDCTGNSTSLSPGDAKNFKFDIGAGTLISGCLSKGDTFSRKVTLNYQDAEGNAYTFVGTMALVATCQ